MTGIQAAAILAGIGLIFGIAGLGEESKLLKVASVVMVVPLIIKLFLEVILN